VESNYRRLVSAFDFVIFGAVIYQISSKCKNQISKTSSKIKNNMEVKYRAFYLSIKVINFIDFLPNKQSIRIICDQLIRSITSIGANIVEAKSSSSKREFLNYFQIALKSANETKYWLALLDKLLPEKSREINEKIGDLNNKIREAKEATAKIAYLAFEQTIEEEQLYIEEQVLSQLNLEIELEFPASLENEMLTGQGKEEKMQASTPEDTNVAPVNQGTQKGVQ